MPTPRRKHLIAILWCLLALPSDSTARIWPIQPGQNNIEAAVAASAPGDTILLASSGVYHEADLVSTHHPLLITAEDGLPSLPVWRTDGIRHLRLGDDTTIRGIRFDGQKRTRHAIRIEATTPPVIRIQDCVFQYLDEDAVTDDDLPIERLSVTGSLFHDIGETAIEFRFADVLQHLQIKNSTFYKIGMYAVHHRGDDTSLTTRIEHVTVDDCYGGLYLDDIDSGFVASSIVTNCFRFGIRSTNPATLIENLTYGNGIDYMGSTAGPGCLVAAPQYYEPDAGNYTLMPSSPALVNAARPMGDLRWTGEISNHVWWERLRRRTAIAVSILFAGALLTYAIFRYAHGRGRSQERLTLAGQVEQSQHLESLGTLAGGIAHDLNNILGVAMGYLDMAHQATNADRRKSHIEGALKAVSDAGQLLRQIVSFSSGAKEELHPVDLGTVVDDVIRLLRPVLPSTISLKTEIQGTPPIISGDVTQIHQILVNLCTNAVDAMSGQGELSVIVRSTNPDTVTLFIKDTGHGMTPEVVARIFDPFFTTKREGEGTGMGLSVVRGIVARLNGRISVDSAPGKGTTFILEMPRHQPQPDKPGDTAGHRILVIDDDQDFLDLVQTLLEREGLAVSTYDSEVTAIEAFTRNPQDFDMVVTDYVMPKLSGVELARKLRHVRPEIPVILVTGYGQYADTDDDLVFSERITKTKVARELWPSINRVLGPRS